MMWRRLQHFGRLPRSDRAALVRAFWTMLWIDIALRTVGFQRLRQRLEQRTGDAAVGPEAISLATRYGYLIRLAAKHHVVRARCLQQSLTLHHWLRSEGIPSELQIGVRKEEGALRAHAWVALGNYVFDEGPAGPTAFVPLRSAVHTRA